MIRATKCQCSQKFSAIFEVYERPQTKFHADTMSDSKFIR